MVTLGIHLFLHTNTSLPMLAGNAHLNHTAHPSSAWEVHRFATELPLASGRPKAAHF